MKKSLIVFGWMVVCFVGFQFFLFAISDAFYSYRWVSHNAIIDGILISVGIVLILKGLGKAFEITEK